MFLFQLLPCSRCQRTFSVRGQITENALLKCPNCGNQFRVGEFLDALYEPWVVVEDPGLSTASIDGSNKLELVRTAARDSAVPAASVALGNDLEVEDDIQDIAAAIVDEEDRGLNVNDHSEGFRLVDDSPSPISPEVDPTTGERQVDWSKFKPITHDEFQKLRRGQRSGIWSVIQVVLGGAAAIPVSLLLIWHVLGKDVAGAGPIVSQYLPWIVPKQFHTTSLPEIRRNDKPQSRIPEPGESGFPKFDDVSSNGLSDASPTDSPSEMVGSLAKNSNGESDDAQKNVNTSVQNTPPVSSTGELIDLIHSAQLKINNLRAVIAQIDTIKQRDGNVAPSELSKQAEAIVSLYGDLARLGAQLAETDPDALPRPIRNELKEMCLSIKRQPEVLQALSQAVRAQLDKRIPKSRPGWVLVCEIGAVQKQQNVYRVMIADPELARLQLPTIEIPTRVVTAVTEGQKLIMLGRFVDDGTVESSSSENSTSSAPESELFRASFCYGL